MVAALSSRGAAKSSACGPCCRQVRAVPVGNTRSLLFDLCDVSYHEGQAYERGRVSGRQRGRLAGMAAMLLLFRPAAPAPVGAVSTGPLTIDYQTRVVLVDGQVIRVTEVEFDILACLGSSLGTLCPYQEIRQIVWPFGLGRKKMNPARLSVRSHAIQVHLTRIRRKLGRAASLLETRPGVGLLLRAEPLIEVVHEDAPR